MLKDKNDKPDYIGEKITETDKNLVGITPEKRSAVAEISNTLYPPRDFFQEERGWADQEVSEYELQIRAKKNEAEYLAQKKRIEDLLLSYALQPTEYKEYIGGLESLTDRSSDLPILIEVMDSLEKVRFWKEAKQKWRVRLSKNSNPEISKKIDSGFEQVLNGLTGKNQWPIPPLRPLAEIMRSFERFLEVFDFVYAATEIKPEEKEQFIYMALEPGLRGNNPDQTRLFMDLYERIKNIDHERAMTFMEIISKYGMIHGLTEKKIEGCEGKLLPAYLERDGQVKVLQIETNSWSTSPGCFGIADFVCHTYASAVTPANINELTIIQKEIPTSNFARFEQNRLDALSIVKVFGLLRDFIHDQRPLVHEVIMEMVAYYESHNDEKLKKVLSNVPYLKTPERMAKILDLKNYDQECEERPSNIKTPAINILRRLELNTEPTVIDPPETGQTKLDNYMQKLNSEEKAEGKVHRETLSATLSYVNEILLQMMRKKEIGLGPALVESICFLDRMAFKFMQSLTYEDISGAYSRDWFKDILLFQELTNSPSKEFDEDNFEKFWGQLQETKKYGQAMANKVAYRLVATRISDNVADLAQIYRAAGKSERTGALWSGNLTHELMGLTYLQTPTTELGRRMRKEELKQDSGRLQGD